MAKKGIKQSPEWVRKRVESRRGYHPSEETLRKQREVKLGANNPMFGRPRTPEAIQKFVKSRTGYRHSDETRKKLALARLNYYKDHPETIEMIKGENNPMFGRTGDLAPMFGKHLSSEAKRRLSQWRVGRFVGPANSFFGRKHSEETRARMKEKWKHRFFKEKDNKLELRLQRELQSKNIIFQKHAEILGRPDIFIKPDLCVFVDGCYWHGCKCKFNIEWTGTHAEYIKSRMKHDVEVNQKLQESGYRVLRLWEHEILKDIDSCVGRVRAYAETKTMVVR